MSEFTDILKIKEMQKSTFNMSAERRAFLRPRTNLRRVGERFTKGLALTMRFPYFLMLKASYFPEDEEMLKPSANNEGRPAS